MGRCNAKSVTRTGFTSSGCQCVNKQGNNLNKKGNPVKKCKRCQQKEALRPSPNVSPPPPGPPTNVSPPPPPPGPNFLEDNVMSMQYGAVEYTPSSPNGNWTSCARSLRRRAQLDTPPIVPTRRRVRIPRFPTLPTCGTCGTARWMSPTLAPCTTTTRPPTRLTS